MRLVQNMCGLCTKDDTNAKATGTTSGIESGLPNASHGDDLLGPLPESSAGNLYVLVIADYFTR